MKRTIEIDDTLEDRIDSAIVDVKDTLEEYLKDNPDTDSVPCISNDLDYSGAIHEIVDSSVPVYTKEIEDIWYMHKRELLEAYEWAGIGTNPQENDGMTAIYCLIDHKIREWYDANAQEVVDEYIRKRELVEKEK